VSLVLLCHACDRQQTNPAPSELPPAPMAILRIEIGAPREIAPGASAQLRATIVKADNSVEDITDRARWSSANSGIVAVAENGRATGVRNGETDVIASYEFRSASARVLILPAGTFRVSGRVTDNGIGVRDATITVLSGTGAGLLARTPESGDYSLYGVAGRARLQVRRDGYVEANREIEVAEHQTQTFELVPERPVLPLAGTYSLTVTAGCRNSVGTLPDAAKTRTYTAIVTQEYRTLGVSLSGADFILANGRGNGFSGLVDASGRITFGISNVGTTYYYYSNICHQCDLVERLTPTNALVIGGSVAAESTPSGIDGILFGAFWLSDGTTPPLNRFLSYCTGVHDFVMHRR
jgi:hypothetical protein